ncbi:MAG: hypothetical protein L6U16_10590 [Porphyromonadaceae bacterium]|nr:MAG: hypothetical protein L6U16_10590 [Porphyromonadaceae bacterium]
MKTIKSPEGVALLMQNLWLRHNAGMAQRKDNVFMVELPLPTEKELKETHREIQDNSRRDDASDELYGAWI